MSTTSTPTAPTPLSTSDLVARTAAFLSAQSASITDLNEGSQIRTLLEAIFSTIEISANELSALAYQYLIYSNYSAFDISPKNATYAVGTVTFSTGVLPNPPAATSDITIPSGTIIETSSGVQFQTTEVATIASGTGQIDVAIEALLAGASGNVSASTITTILTGLQTTLYVTNASPTNSGSDAETPSATASRFANAVNALHLSSPAAIAGAVIGVTYKNEIVKHSAVHEPWIDNIANGAGWNLYIDNGSGSASSDLIANVKKLIDGDLIGFTSSGYRPSGVPYNVYAATPVDVYVKVAATAKDSSQKQTIADLATTTIQTYFNNLNFNETADVNVLYKLVSNAIDYLVSSITVTLSTSSSFSSSANTITATNPGERIILNATPTMTIT